MELHNNIIQSRIQVSSFLTAYFWADVLYELCLQALGAIQAHSAAYLAGPVIISLILLSSSITERIWVSLSGMWFLDAKQRLYDQTSSVYGSKTSSVVLSTHNSVLSTRIKRQSGFQPSPVVLCMQTATLALELLVSIVPCPHLRFLHANQRLLDQNYKSLWVQDLTCRFVHA